MLGMEYLTGALPGSLRRWLLEADLRNDDAFSSLQLAKEVVDAIVGGGAIKEVEAIEHIAIRSLVVVALKTGIVSTDDSLDDAITLGKHLRVGNQDSKVVFCKMARHDWQLQDPILVASTVTAWMEGNMLLPQIEVVDMG